MMRFRCLLFVLTLFVLLAGTAGHSVAAAKQESITQRDFMAMLIKAFRWDKGLPAIPADRDYLAIMGGHRALHFEAEDHYSVKTDNAVVRNYLLYGPFSGNGWVSGVAVPTTVTFKLFLPLEGDYALTVSSKGDGQIWSAGEKKFKISTGERLRQETVGTVRLKAGEQELSVELPPEGAIDFFRLDAQKLAAVEPVEGWRLDAPLTLGTFAEITASLLPWERAMPEDPGVQPVKISVSDAAPIPQGAQATAIDYLGSFESAKWIRAGRSGARIVVPLIVADSALYRLKARLLGEKVEAELDGRKIQLDGKAYLDWVDLGVSRLRVGAHTLILRLPPNGGIDVITLTKMKSSPQDYMKLAGVEGGADDRVSKAQAERLLTSLVERFEVRR